MIAPVVVLALWLTLAQATFCPKNSVADSSGSKCFRFFSKPRSFDDAREFCTEIDGQIANLWNATDIWAKVKVLTGQKECLIWAGNRANNNSNSCTLILDWKYEQDASNCTILAPFVCELAPTCQTGAPTALPPTTSRFKTTAEPSKLPSTTRKPTTIRYTPTSANSTTKAVTTTTAAPSRANFTQNAEPRTSSTTTVGPSRLPLSTAKPESCPTPPKTQKQCVTTVNRTPNWLIFNNSQYLYFSKEKKNWNAAEEYCKSQGGSLTSIHSQCEFNFIISNICDYVVWIGGVVRNEEPSWVDGTKWDFTKFGNNTFTQPEYGIYIYWKNYNDSNTRVMQYGKKSFKASFVCKKPLKD